MPLIKEMFYTTGTQLSFEIDIIWYNFPDNDPPTPAQTPCCLFVHLIP
jgi:hypothetical protein